MLFTSSNPLTRYRTRRRNQMSKKPKILRAFDMICRAALLVPEGDRKKILDAAWVVVQPESKPNKTVREKNARFTKSVLPQNIRVKCPSCGQKWISTSGSIFDCLKCGGQIEAEESQMTEPDKVSREVNEAEKRGLK